MKHAGKSQKKLVNTIGMKPKNAQHLEHLHLICQLCIRFALCLLEVSSRRDSSQNTWVVNILKYNCRASKVYNQREIRYASRPKRV